MNRVAAYFRTSSTTNEDGHSRQRQEDAVNEYAKRMGYDIEVTRWDVHTGDSTMIDRPGFSELLAEIQSRDISIILIQVECPTDSCRCSRYVYRGNTKQGTDSTGPWSSF